MDSSETRIINALNAGLSGLRSEMSDLRSEMHAGFNRLDGRIDSLLDLHKSDMSGVRRRFDRLENEMREGFAKQERLSHDIIETMAQSFHSYSIYVDKEFKTVGKDISHIQTFLSTEFPGKYKPLSPS